MQRVEDLKLGYFPFKIVRYFEHVRIPWSEVCMHMRIAGKVMSVVIFEDAGSKRPAAQIVDGFGKAFSSPVLLSEAGVNDRTIELMSGSTLEVRL